MASRDVQSPHFAMKHGQLILDQEFVSKNTKIFSW